MEDATFADVEELLTVPGMAGFTQGDRTTKRIIGDMSQLYYVDLSHRAEDERADLRTVLADKVEMLREVFPFLHFETSEIGNSASRRLLRLRVGRIPPRDAGDITDEVLESMEEE